MASVPISGSLSRRFVQSNINIQRGDPHHLPVVDTVRGRGAVDAERSGDTTPSSKPVPGRPST